MTAHLDSSWLPAVDCVVERLYDGATVANVGCGSGASTVVLAQTFEHSSFVGYDVHESSIEAARAAAARAGVDRRAKFEVASAEDFPGTGYDVVCWSGCVGDLSDPIRALRHVRESMAADGALLLIGPAAVERLGPRNGRRSLEEVLHEAGFSHVRVATRTPRNVVIEARA